MENRQEKYSISTKRYKTASNYLLIIGLSHLFIFLNLMYTSSFLISSVYLVTGIVFLILSVRTKREEKKILLYGIILWSLIILIDIVYLALKFNWGFLVFLLIKFSVLLYLIEPFRKNQQKEKFWEKGISKLPYVLPIITLLPFLVVFYIIYLITDNIFKSSLFFVPPILFLLLWLYFSEKRKKKQIQNKEKRTHEDRK